jgi:hypothetical protein
MILAKLNCQTQNFSKGFELVLFYRLWEASLSLSFGSATFADVVGPRAEKHWAFGQAFRRSRYQVMRDTIIG